MLIGNQNNLEKLDLKSNLTPKLKCYTKLKQKTMAENSKCEIETIK